LLVVGCHESVLLLDVHLLQHLSVVVHASPGHSRGVSSHWRPLTMMDHHHSGVHVRRLEINLRLLEKVETGGFYWHWRYDWLLLNLLLLLLSVMLLLLNLLWEIFVNWLLLWLLLLRGTGEYWHGFLLLLNVVVAKHVIGLVNAAVAIGHLWLDDGLSSRHRLLILILSVLSVVVILGGHVVVGLSVGGGVLGPLGLDVARLADQVDQSMELLIGASGNGAGLLIREVGQVLGADVDLLVEAALLLDLPVGRNEGGELGELIHLLRA